MSGRVKRRAVLQCRAQSGLERRHPAPLAKPGSSSWQATASSRRPQNSRERASGDMWAQGCAVIGSSAPFTVCNTTPFFEAAFSRSCAESRASPRQPEDALARAAAPRARTLSNHTVCDSWKRSRMIFLFSSTESPRFFDILLKCQVPAQSRPFVCLEQLFALCSVWNNLFAKAENHYGAASPKVDVLVSRVRLCGARARREGASSTVVELGGGSQTGSGTGSTPSPRSSRTRSGHELTVTTLHRAESRRPALKQVAGTIARERLLRR